MGRRETHTHNVRAETRGPMPGTGRDHEATPFTAPFPQPLSSLPGDAPSDTSLFSFLFCLKNQYTVYVGHGVRSETCTLETTIFVPFLFSIIVFLCSPFVRRDRPLKMPPSAGLRGSRRGFLWGTGKEGVGVTGARVRHPKLQGISHPR